MGNKLDRSNERELDLKIAMEKAKQLDVDTLLQYAMDHIILVYEEDEECFRRDWDANMK